LDSFDLKRVRKGDPGLDDRPVKPGGAGHEEKEDQEKAKKRFLVVTKSLFHSAPDMN
jgi:hypothetical protein